jgi:cytochrome c biogenesis protein CcdA
VTITDRPGRAPGEARPRGKRTTDASVGEVVELLKEYAQQETIEPLRGAGRWLAMGVAGAFILGLGLIYVLLGVLRLIQTEWVRAASGSLSWLSYLIVLLLAIGMLAVVIRRINKDHLNKPGQDRTEVGS